jgi:hypothetical protein
MLGSTPRWLGHDCPDHRCCEPRPTPLKHPHGSGGKDSFFPPSPPAALIPQLALTGDDTKVNGMGINPRDGSGDLRGTAVVGDDMTTSNESAGET